MAERRRSEDSISNFPPEYWAKVENARQIAAEALKELTFRPHDIDAAKAKLQTARNWLDGLPRRMDV